MASPINKTHKPRRRLWLKLGALFFALTFVSIVVLFLLRIEKFILARLPSEVVPENLSVSFLGRSFVMTRVRISGRAGSPCAGKLMSEIGQLTGSFSLRHRRLTQVALKDVRLTSDALKRACLVPPAEKERLRLSDIAMPGGLSVNIEQLQFPLPEFGAVVLNSRLSLSEPKPQEMALSAERVQMANRRLVIEATGLRADFVRGSGAYVLTAANFSLFARITELDKLPRLKSRKLTVLAGEAEIRSKVLASSKTWNVDTKVALKKVRVKGAPLFKMPFGLLQVTPESLWPMAEDSPGLFEFAFKTEADRDALPRRLASDAQRALTAKLRGNVKKKMPGIPL